MSGPGRVRHLLRFAVLAMGLLVLYHAPYPDRSLPVRLEDAYLRLCAAAAGLVVARFDPTASVQGTVLGGRFPIRVGKGCDAAEPHLLLAAALLALPVGGVRRRLLGLGMGSALLFGLNSLRLASLGLLGAARPDLFEVVHLQVWPPVLLGAAAAVFRVVARWVSREAADASA